MATNGLSDECKQKLRDIDGDLAGISLALKSQDYGSVAGMGSRIVVSLQAMRDLEPPCQEVLRSIDDSAGAMTLAIRLQQLDSEPGLPYTLQLLDHLSEVRLAIERQLLR